METNEVEHGSVPPITVHANSPKTVHQWLRDTQCVSNSLEIATTEGNETIALRVHTNRGPAVYVLSGDQLRDALRRMEPAQEPRTRTSAEQVPEAKPDAKAQNAPEPAAEEVVKANPRQRTPKEDLGAEHP